MVAFPLIKLGTLAVKQISKPISKSIRAMAKGSPFMRRYICMPPAQFYHWMDVNLKMRILGLGKATEVKPLSEEAAVELGSEIIGESFIFSVAVGTLVFEYWRSSKKEEQHETKQSIAIRELEGKVRDLGLALEEQDAKLRELNRLVVEYAPSSKK
ncbi:putative OPA3-like protein CG13603 [Diadema setosum]|uniref:putative OPA3-like protein CG13603 n=1 Tax=Diadema antillarum TaxID=105358 RepID=UPI003A88B6B2